MGIRYGQRWPLTVICCFYIAAATTNNGKVQLSLVKLVDNTKEQWHNKEAAFSLSVASKSQTDILSHPRKTPNNSHGASIAEPKRNSSQACSAQLVPRLFLVLVGKACEETCTKRASNVCDSATQRKPPPTGNTDQDIVLCVPKLQISTALHCWRVRQRTRDFLFYSYFKEHPGEIWGGVWHTRGRTMRNLKSRMTRRVKEIYS